MSAPPKDRGANIRKRLMARSRNVVTNVKRKSVDGTQRLARGRRSKPGSAPPPTRRSPAARQRAPARAAACPSRARPRSRSTRLTPDRGRAAATPVKSVVTSAAAREELATLNYYHGWLAREDAEQKLNKCTDGSFLVRTTDPTTERSPQMVISLKTGKDKFSHYMVQQNERGQYFVEQVKYATIGQLVDAYRWPAADETPFVRLGEPIVRQDWQLRHRQIELREKLGDGAFGEVRKGVLRTAAGDTLEVAIKTNNKVTMQVSRDERLKLMEEARVMRDYAHPNIVRLLGVALDEEPFMIVLELAPHGSLFSHLREKGASVVPRERMRFCVEAADGMRYLESVHCIHRDVAARNCLLGAKLQVKISDFGLSCTTENVVQHAQGDRLPIKWLAPEVLKLSQFTLKSDVWAFGVLLWEVFADAKTPYPGLTNLETKQRVGVDNYRMEAPVGTPPDVSQLMQECWAALPNKRPGFRVICKRLRTNFDNL